MRISNFLSGLAIGLAALLPPLASGARAQEAENAATTTYYVWQGVAIVDTATSCGTANGRTNIAKGTSLTVIVRPKSLGSNGATNRVGFTLEGNGEYALDLGSGVISGTGSDIAYGVTTSGVPEYGVGGGSYSSFVMTPSTLTSTTTASVTLTGTIKGFMFRPACIITFHAGFIPRIN